MNILLRIICFLSGIVLLIIFGDGIRYFVSSFMNKELSRKTYPVVFIVFFILSFGIYIAFSLALRGGI